MTKSMTGPNGRHLQTTILGNMMTSPLKDKKILWEKEKMTVTSIFPFQTAFSQGQEKYGKGLNNKTSNLSTMKVLAVGWLIVLGFNATLTANHGGL